MKWFVKKKEKFSALGIKRIYLDCDMNVKFSTHKSSSILIALTSIASDCKINFKTEKKEGSLFISTLFSDSFSSDSFCLHIFLPFKTFQEINVTSFLESIIISKNVRAKTLRASTVSGDILCSANFSKGIFTTKSNGNIVLSVSLLHPSNKMFCIHLEDGSVILNFPDKFKIFGFAKETFDVSILGNNIYFSKMLATFE